MPIVLPKLPYAYDALEPFISRATLETHYGQHHSGYVHKANAHLAHTALAHEPHEAIVRTARYRGMPALFNMAAQAWNHAFLWQSMRPGGGGVPTGEIAKEIERHYGTYDTFIKHFTSLALSQFGSGWAWLVFGKGGLAAEVRSNADTPLVHGEVPLLTIDLWEHAYYLDYRHRREEYVTNILAKLVNWDFANENLRHAQGSRTTNDSYADNANVL